MGEGQFHRGLVRPAGDAQVLGRSLRIMHRHVDSGAAIRIVRGQQLHGRPAGGIRAGKRERRFPGLASHFAGAAREHDRGPIAETPYGQLRKTHSPGAPAILRHVDAPGPMQRSGRSVRRNLDRDVEVCQTRIGASRPSQPPAAGRLAPDAGPNPAAIGRHVQIPSRVAIAQRQREQRQGVRRTEQGVRRGIIALQQTHAVRRSLEHHL